MWLLIMEAKPMWQYICVKAEQETPLNVIGLATIKQLLTKGVLLVRSPALFIRAIGEIASAYVTIAVSNRVKRMRNGNLN